jgi:hypothetical protein
MASWLLLWSQEEAVLELWMCARDGEGGREHILVKAVAQLVPPWPCTTE